MLWELIARKCPFEALKVWDVPLAVMRGDRPTMPSSSNPATRHTDEFAKLIKKCWHAKPASRPSFREIHKELCKQRLTLASKSKKRLSTHLRSGSSGSNGSV